MKPDHLALLECVVLLGCWAIPAHADEAPAPPGRTPWHGLPLPEGRGGITDIAVDKSGQLWGLMRGGVYFWDGSRFRPPDGVELSTGVYVTKLIGGTDRELYVSQVDDRAHEGEIFQLNEGQAEYLTDFSYDNRGEPPPLYVSRSGLICNWGERFLAIFSDGAWQRQTLDVGAVNVQVVEVGGRICILGKNPKKLYVIDARGQIKEREMTFGETVPLEKPPSILPWGDGRLLALSEEVQRVLAFDISSGEAVDTGDLNRQLQDRRSFALFGQAVGIARHDGSIWLRRYADDMYAFDRISPAGAVMHVEGTASRAWSRGTFVRFPHIVLETSDGAMWFALDDTTIARHQKGRLRHFDWRDGLCSGKFNRLREGSRGEVYAASLGAIRVWRPQELRPVPEWTRLWNEYESASFAPIRDARGNVWTMLRDRPGEISRWDGRAWHHRPVPWETTKIYGGMADDQGHVLLIGSPECHDIGPAGVKTFADVKAALVAAAARGVKRFVANGGVQVRTAAGNQIWMGRRNAAEVHHYTGQRWESLSLRDGLGDILASQQHGVLLRGQNGKFYEYDEGRLSFVTDTSSHTRWLLGSNMLQPYESALLDQRPRDFVIVQHGQLTIRTRETESDGRHRTTFRQGDELPGGLWRTLTRGWRHGHWTDYAAGPIYRLMGNRVIQCDWQETPLFGREYEIRQVLEDRGGNLWTYAGRQVFMKRPGHFKIEAVGTDRIERGAAQIEVETAKAWQGGYQPRIFWRVDRGPWNGGEATHRITVPLAGLKACVVEIIGMDRLGATTKILRQRIEARDQAGSGSGE